MRQVDWQHVRVVVKVTHPEGAQEARRCAERCWQRSRSQRPYFLAHKCVLVAVSTRLYDSSDAPRRSREHMRDLVTDFQAWSVSRIAGRQGRAARNRAANQSRYSSAALSCNTLRIVVSLTSASARSA